MTRAEQEERIRQMLGRLKDARVQGALSDIPDALTFTQPRCPERYGLASRFATTPSSRCSCATAMVDACVALAQAVERAEHKPEPARLLGWV